MSLLPGPEGIVLRRVWRETERIWFLVIFVLFWNGCLARWYFHEFGRPEPSLWQLLFPVIHVGAGLYLSYFLFAAIFNRTDITISGSEVRIASGPVPWWGNRRIAVADIAAIMVREKASGYSSTYTVMQVDRAQKERPLVKLVRYEQATFTARVLRETLGVRDEND